MMVTVLPTCMLLSVGRRVAVVALIATTTGEARATADGPDHYRVRGVASGHHLVLRSQPSVSSPQIARIPADAACLRSLGCRGGLSFEEFTTLTEEERQRRAAENPRWCKVEYEGTAGWVLGKYLAEDACSPSTARGPSR